MTTREEQIRAAREFAERNPEWVWTGEELSFENGWHTVYPSVSGLRWHAHHHFSGTIRSARTCRVTAFRSPSAAVKALGFDIREE